MRARLARCDQCHRAPRQFFALIFLDEMAAANARVRLARRARHLRDQRRIGAAENRIAGPEYAQERFLPLPELRNKGEESAK